MKSYKLCAPAHILLLVACISCGYRGGEVFDDVFNGDWNIERIDCYGGSFGDTTELYLVKSPVESAVFSFSGSNFNYSAEVSGSPDCQVDITGYRHVEYNDQNSGVISFLNVSEYSACSAVLNEESGLATSISVPFGFGASSASQVPWVSGEDIEMKLPVDFSGSSSGPCGAACSCVATLVKN